MALRPVAGAYVEMHPQHRSSNPRIKMERRSHNFSALSFRCTLASLPDLSIPFQRAVYAAPARPVRRFSTGSLSQKGKEIQQNMEKASKSSLYEQQQLLLRGITDCFEEVLPLPLFKQGFTPADVQYLLKKTESSSDIQMPNIIFPAQRWADQDWENAIRGLLFRLGSRRAPWASPEAKNYFFAKLAFNKIVWPRSPFKIYPSEVYKIPGSAARALISSLKEEAKENPQLKLILVQEGIWSGRVLIDCYQRISQEVGIPVKIVASDFSPASLGTFLVYAEQIAKIPKQDVYAFKNDPNFPLGETFLQEQGLSPQDSRVYYLYFPVLYNVPGDAGIKALFKNLSERMKKGDRVHLYEAEDSDPEERKPLDERKAILSAKFIA